MNSGRDGALAPYARMLREHRVLIVLLTLLCAGATAAYSFTRESEYQSVAQLSFQEESQSNAVAGVAAQQVQTAAELAAKGVSVVLSDDVLDAVKQRLNTPLSVDDLRSDLKADVDINSNLVDITATAKNPQFAAALANEVARQTVGSQVNSERARFARIADQVQEQLTIALRQSRKDDVAGAIATASGYSDRLASLKTLAISATPVRLAASAAVADGPSSPKPIRDTIIGAFVGLLLALVIAFLRDSLDRRLRDVADVREYLELPAVGVLRRDAFGRLPFVGHDETQLEAHDVEAFRTLRTNVELIDAERPPRSIVVTSPLPQEGKSTVAAGLALVSAAAGKRTILVECDLRRPCLAERLELAPGPGLGDYLAGTATPEEVLRVVDLPPNALASAAGDGHQQLVVVPAGPATSSPAELLGSAQFHEFVEEISGVYDAVIIDTAPLLSVADTLAVIPNADAVVLCIRADQTTKNQATAAKDALARVPDTPVALVVTGVAPHRDADYGYYSSTYVTS